MDGQISKVCPAALKLKPVLSCAEGSKIQNSQVLASVVTLVFLWG
jgi:hypothetical protein